MKAILYREGRPPNREVKGREGEGKSSHPPMKAPKLVSILKIAKIGANWVHWTYPSMIMMIMLQLLTVKTRKTSIFNFSSSKNQ